MSSVLNFMRDSTTHSLTVSFGFPGEHRHTWGHYCCRLKGHYCRRLKACTGMGMHACLAWTISDVLDAVLQSIKYGIVAALSTLTVVHDRSSCAMDVLRSGVAAYLIAFSVSLLRTVLLRVSTLWKGSGVPLTSSRLLDFWLNMSKYIDQQRPTYESYGDVVENPCFADPEEAVKVAERRFNGNPVALFTCRFMGNAQIATKCLYFVIRSFAGSMNTMDMMNEERPSELEFRAYDPNIMNISRKKYREDVQTYLRRLGGRWAQMWFSVLLYAARTTDSMVVQFYDTDQGLSHMQVFEESVARKMKVRIERFEYNERMSREELLQRAIEFVKNHIPTRYLRHTEQGLYLSSEMPTCAALADLLREAQQSDESRPFGSV